MSDTKTVQKAIEARASAALDADLLTLKNNLSQNIGHMRPIRSDTESNRKGSLKELPPIGEYFTYELRGNGYQILKAHYLPIYIEKEIEAFMAMHEEMKGRLREMDYYYEQNNQ